MGSRTEHIKVVLNVHNGGGDRQTLEEAAAAELTARIQAIAEEPQYQGIYVYVDGTDAPPPEEVAAARHRIAQDNEDDE